MALSDRRGTRIEAQPREWRAFVPGDVNDRHGNVRFFETVSQLDTRTIAQVDVEKDANHPVKIAVICEGFRRRKQQAS